MINICLKKLKTSISDLVCITCFWNDLYWVDSVNRLYLYCIDSESKIRPLLGRLSQKIRPLLGRLRVKRSDLYYVDSESKD